MAFPKNKLMVDPNELIIVGRDTEADETHPLFDERANWPVEDHMVTSILAYGVQQAVAVREEGGKYFVIDGRQRVINAREAAKRQKEAGMVQVLVPVDVKVGDDNNAQGLGVTLNEIRTDDDILTRARKAARRMAMTGENIEAVAADFGKSVQQIRNYLSLVKADPKLHDAVESKKINATVAIEIARLPRDEQMPELEKRLEAAGTRKVTAQAAKKGVAQRVGGTAASDKPSVRASGGATERKPNARQALQQGIKRTDLRVLLDTDVAKNLQEDRRKVLRWFAYGESAKDDWFDNFVFDASAELERKAKAPKEPKAPKAPKEPKAPKAAKEPKAAKAAAKEPKAPKAPKEAAAKAPKAPKEAAAKAPKETKAAKAPKAPADEIDKAITRKAKAKPAEAPAEPAAEPNATA